MKSSFLSLALVPCLTVGAHAVTLVTSEIASTTAQTTSLTISGFDMGAGNAIAILISGEDQTGPFQAPTVTLDGVALTGMTDSVFVNQANQGSAIVWAINPTTTSGDLTVTLANNTAFAITALSLSGVVSAFDTATAVGTSTQTYNLTYDGTANGFMVATGVDNRNSTSTLTVGGDVFTTYTQQLAATATGASNAISQGYGSITADGTYTTTFTPASGSNSTRNAFAAVSFTSVPEPASSVALLGSLGVLALRRRRF